MTKKKLLFPQSIVLPYHEFYTQTYNEYRRYSILMFTDTMTAHSFFNEMEECDRLKLVKNIEIGCWEAAKKFTKENDQDVNSVFFTNSYKYICGNLISSMEIDDYILDLLIEGKIQPERLGFLDADELCPHKYDHIKKKIQERAEIKHNFKTCTKIQCRACKKKECTLERMQLRSLDEGTNYRATCSFCKNTWII